MRNIGKPYGLHINDAEDENNAVEYLKKTLESLSYIPFDNLLEHSATGLLKIIDDETIVRVY